MDLKEKIGEFKEAAEALKREATNFSKDSKSRKTSEYKRKKLAKLEQLMRAIKQTASEIVDLFEKPDPCFTKEYEDLLRFGDSYLSELQKIEDDESKQPSPVQLHIQQQDVRFEGLRRALEDVQSKLDSGEPLPSVYAKMKLRTINDSWERLQVADEEVDFNRQELPQEYLLKLIGFENEVEMIVFTLEQILHNQPQLLHQNDYTEGVKLPRVVIPKYNGDYFKWTTFKDLFTTMVINKVNLSDGQRMQLLKTSVEGEAASLIEDLTIADIHFESAWTRLCERYDNRRVVVGKYMTRMMSQPDCRNNSVAIKKLLDTTEQTLLALANLGRPINHWDDWIVLIIGKKLDVDQRREWERKVRADDELPTWAQLKQFLAEEFRMLENIEQNSKQKYSTEKSGKPGVIKSYLSTVDMKTCPVCNETHRLFDCSRFKKMDVNQRWNVARANKLCFSCLQLHDEQLRCEKVKPCKKCPKLHSTWLHDEKKDANKKGANNAPKSSGSEIVNAVGTIDMTTLEQTEVLLATIVIMLTTETGQEVLVRGLVDSGSQGSMITERMATLLKLERYDTGFKVNCLGGSVTRKTEAVRILMRPRFYSEESLEVSFHVMPKLTKPLPNNDIDTKSWHHLVGLTLADPHFDKVGPIDVLLGADVIGDIMMPGLVKGAVNQPMAQQTTFGWIVSGKLDVKYTRPQFDCYMATDDDHDIQRFWEMEELNPKRALTQDELKCEEMFEETCTRDETGRMVVKIPFKTDGLGPERLGDSRNQCMARFMYLERRFKKDSELKTEYVKVMEEYLQLGHMVDVTNLSERQKRYYIPHHAVVKPGSLTTKTRVVFDASAKTTSGYSLNDCMYTGGKQQDDLLEILARWRKFPVVMKADIEKMYRMIRIDKEDQRFHTIFWRKNVNEPIREYQLNTVTFGTAAAPFLATRTLTKIAEDCKELLPLASQAIRTGFYVDDFIFGGDNHEEVLECKQQVIAALTKYGLQLRKWTSNDMDVLQSVPEQYREKTLQQFELHDHTKALGIQWNPQSDKFSFALDWDWQVGALTKRKVFSEASKLFDPLGWCAPVIVTAKLIMQEVWNSKIGWDELVGPVIEEKWTQFKEELSDLNKISIDRWIQHKAGRKIQLHGFCDASEKAYAAVVYTRVENDGKVEIKLMAAKTRVAPIKSKLTIPKLELCSTVLLAKLINTTKESLQIADVESRVWSDSMVSLAWLKGEPSRWNTFVANRVVEVAAYKVDNWSHVRSEDNPADCASRGLMPSELASHPLWWTGPSWLSKSEEHWPQTMIPDTAEEARAIHVNVAIKTRSNQRTELLLGESDWTKKLRVLALCLKWKNKTMGTKITASEVRNVRNILVKECQAEMFPVEVARLLNQQEIPSTSKLLNLNPFLDKNGIMRVGGRLDNAPISYDNKHPIILPAKHSISQAIIHQMHMDTLHGGPQLMLNLLRKQFWVINGKRVVNTEYKSCVNCKRMAGKTIQQMMGDLPADRVTPGRAFQVTGVDYAGPLEVRTSTLRAAKLQKGYIAVFVCMSTKATHLELVSDISTAAFLAAFNRFIARRGLPERMWSDNGTNFVGARNKLAKEEAAFLEQKTEAMMHLATGKGIEWKFIPPGTPNFGGLWERTVRSAKDHLKRMSIYWTLK